MLDDILSALISVAVVAVVAFPLGGLLKKRPLPFYIVAALLVGAYLFYKFEGLYIAELQTVVGIVSKGYLACTLLAVVMFIGVLDETSPARRRLQPIRAELSILSFILILGHAIAYLPSYLPRLGVIFSSRLNLAFSISVAMLLVVVFAILAATSLRVFRTKMPYRVWKGIQRMSYLMVALLYLHIVLALGRSAFVGAGSDSVKFALAVYTVVVVVYAVLRVRKALRDRVRRASVVDTAVSDGR